MTDVKGMPDDLRWLAENVSEWGGTYTYSYIFRDRCFNKDDYSAERMDGDEPSFTREEWQTARQQLGLEPRFITDKEEADYQNIEPEKSDMVNHPPHYQSDNGIECIEAIRAQMTLDQFAAYCQGNVVKYMWRWRNKAGVESLRKAEWYLAKMIEELEK